METTYKRKKALKERTRQAIEYRKVRNIDEYKKKKYPVEVPKYYPDKISYLRFPMELQWGDFKNADKVCYAIISVYKQFGCFVAYKTIAMKINYDQTTVRDSIQRLKKLGLVERIPFYGKTNKKSNTTLILTNDFSNIGINMEYEDKRHEMKDDYEAGYYLKEYNSLSQHDRNTMRKLRLDIWHLMELKEGNISLEDFSIMAENRPSILKDSWQLHFGDLRERYIENIKHS